MPRFFSYSWLITDALSPPDKDEPAEPPEPQPTAAKNAPESKAPTMAAMDKEDFEKTVLPQIPRLYRLCLALTCVPDQAEDLLQASLIKAYLRCHTFAGRGSLFAWLAAIVRHEHLETTRRAARRGALFQAAQDHISDFLDNLHAPSPPDPESWSVRREQASFLLQCIHNLKEPYRTIIWLCDVEELGYDEVGDILQIPVGTVKSRHARGRARLKRALERCATNHGQPH